MGNRVLVDGASGFIGSNVVRALIGKGYEPILISRNPEKLRELFPELPAFSVSEIERAFSLKPFAVVNSVGILKEEDSSYEEVHVEFTKRLVELSRKFGVKKFVQISALGVFPNEKSRYFKTKWQAEEIVRKSGIPFAILRPSIVLGEGQKLYSDLEKLSKFLPILGAPRMKVQPVRIEKVVETVLKAVECSVEGTVELCGDEVISMAELFRKVLKELGIKRPVFEVPKFLLFPLAVLGIGGLNLEQYRMIKDNVCGGKSGGAL